MSFVIMFRCDDVINLSFLYYIVPNSGDNSLLSAPQLTNFKTPTMIFVFGQELDTLFTINLLVLTKYKVHVIG